MQMFFIGKFQVIIIFQEYHKQGDQCNTGNKSAVATPCQESKYP